jgi:hypothetical protein
MTQYGRRKELMGKEEGQILFIAGGKSIMRRSLILG